MLVITIQRFIFYFSEKIDAVHTFFEGRPLLVVDDGKINHEELKKIGITHQDLLMQLRLEGIEFLEEVRIAYVEASGRFSIFKKNTFEKKTSTLPEKE